MVGGYTPEKVALRRAISLALQDRRTRSRSSARARRSRRRRPYAPGRRRATTRTSAPTPASTTSPKAKALLDMFGYVDRDGDGYREMPDGSAARDQGQLHAHARATSRSTSCGSAAWTTSACASRFRKAKWPDLLKEARAGKLQFWQLGGTASAPDADTWLTSLYGKNTRARQPARASSSPSTTGSTSRRASMPDSPERTQALPADGEDRGRLRAVEDQHAPHPHRHVVSARDRLLPPAGREHQLVEVHRHRPGRSSAHAAEAGPSRRRSSPPGDRLFSSVRRGGGSPGRQRGASVGECAPSSSRLPAARRLRRRGRRFRLEHSPSAAPASSTAARSAETSRCSSWATATPLSTTSPEWLRRWCARRGRARP